MSDFMLSVLYLLYLFIIFTFFNYLKWYLRFKKSSYKEETKNNFVKTIVLNDLGLIGEFDTFRLLENVPGAKKILVNLYLPVSEDETTEIDLIFIHGTGIYVIESKNYSGYIYGNEKYKNWVQILNRNTKNYFFNPILQNKKHIKYLQQFIGTHENIFSIIVFSNRCALKKINYYSDNTIVLKREDLKKYIEKKIIFGPVVYSETEINELYDKLKYMSNQSKEVKEKHIEQLHKKHNI